MSVEIPFLPKYEPMRTHSEDGQRFYDTPLGLQYSVTTVLSGSRDDSGLQLWREYMGEERANEIVARACNRGERHHTNVERYLLDGIEPVFNWLEAPYWESTKDFLKTVRKPLLIEGAVWHPDKFAGTLDCIAYLDGDGDQPTLLDWKTADKLRNEGKVYEYSLQLAAYTKAANWVYAKQGLNIQQAKLVIALPDENPQIETFDADALKQLYLHFLGRKERFIKATKS